jgi:hypothetical protein
MQQDYSMTETLSEHKMEESSWTILQTLANGSFLVGLSSLLFILFYIFVHGTEVFEKAANNKGGINEIKEDWVKVLLVIAGIAAVFSVLIFLWAVLKFSAWWIRGSDEFSNWYVKKWRQYEDWKTSWYQGTVMRGFRTVYFAIQMIIQLFLFALAVYAMNMIKN